MVDCLPIVGHIANYRDRVVSSKTEFDDANERVERTQLFAVFLYCASVLAFAWRKCVTNAF